VSPHDWDAALYDRVAGGIIALGHEVLGRLPLRGDETVLDAGCGSGDVTEALVDRLPRGRVIGVDASPTMVAAARKRLAGAGKDARARFEVADLLDLDLDAPVDAVLSTATFHWIGDHDRLFSRLHGALRPRGRLVAQCGGSGNIAEVVAAVGAVAAQSAFSADLQGFEPWNFATPEETEQRLRAAGFAEARCWLEDRPVKPDAPIEYVATMIVGGHLERLPEPARRPFVEAVVDRLATPLVIGYVRLNIDAVA
jgi:trans-aconitate 2-methyltransferase